MTPAKAPTVINPNSGPKIVDTYRFTMKAAPSLNVATANGSVTITGGTGHLVVVTVTRRGGSGEQMKAIDVRAVRKGNEVDVASTMPAGCVSCTASYEITVPRDTAVVASSANGAVKIEDIAGTVKASSALGAVLAGGLSGNVKLASGNGFVNAGFDDLAKVTSIDLASGNGAVRLVLPHGGTLGHLKAATGNGKITSPGLQLSVVEKGNASSVDQTLAKNGPQVNLGTGNGAISIVQMP